MYAQPVDAERKDGLSRNDTVMAGFYIQHNTSIGLQCFAWGLFFGLGSLYELALQRDDPRDGLRPHGGQPERGELLHVRDRARAVRADGDRLLGGGRAAARLGPDRHPGPVAARLAPPRGRPRLADRRRGGRPVRPGGVPRRVRLGVDPPVRRPRRRSPSPAPRSWSSTWPAAVARIAGAGCRTSSDRVRQSIALGHVRIVS